MITSCPASKIIFPPCASIWPTQIRLSSPGVPSLDLAFHWWSFSLCLSFSKSNISYLEWDFYISVIFASNTLNMAHVVRLQMLIEYNFSVTIIWCPKFIPCTRLRCAYNWAYETNRYYHCLVSVAVVSLLPWRLSSRNLIWRIIHLVRFIVVFDTGYSFVMITSHEGK